MFLIFLSMSAWFRIDVVLTRYPVLRFNLTPKTRGCNKTKHTRSSATSTSGQGICCTDALVVVTCVTDSCRAVLVHMCSRRGPTLCGPICCTRRPLSGINRCAPLSAAPAPFPKKLASASRAMSNEWTPSSIDYIMIRSPMRSWSSIHDKHVATNRRHRCYLMSGEMLTLNFTSCGPHLVGNWNKMLKLTLFASCRSSFPKQKHALVSTKPGLKSAPRKSRTARAHHSRPGLQHGRPRKKRHSKICDITLQYTTSPLKISRLFAHEPFRAHKAGHTRRGQPRTQQPPARGYDERSPVPT